MTGLAASRWALALLAVAASGFVRLHAANILNPKWVGREMHLVDEDKGSTNSNLYWTLPPARLAEVRGKTLTLAGRVRQVKSSGVASLGLSLGARRKGQKWYASSEATVPTRGSTPWMTLRARLSVPQDADSVRVMVLCAHGFFQTGEAFFKDLVLTADESEVPPADVPAPDVLGHAEATVPDPHDSPEYAAYRATYRDMKPFGEDGRVRPEIRNGTWYYKGKPTFFLGAWIYPRSTTDWGPGCNPLGIDHIAYTTPPGEEVFEAMGLNSAQISAAPSRPGEVLHGLPERALRRGGQPSTWKVDEKDMSEFFARFRDVPMAMDFAFGYDKTFPGDLSRLLNQYATEWHAFVPFCPEHPEGWAYYRDYFTAGTRAALKYGLNPFLYELFNESNYNCRCPWNRRAFADAAKARYGTIAAANAKWGTEFLSFDDVVCAGDMSGRPGLWYDWCRFSGRRYAELLKKGASVIRGVDRRRNVYFTEQAHGTPPEKPGMDYRLIADALDVLTIEGGWQYGFKTTFNAQNEMEAVVATGGSKHFFNLAFFRALSKDKKPVSNNEHYCTRFENGLRVPSRRTDYVTSMWLELMHGVSSSYVYVLDKRHWEARTMKQAYDNVAKPSYKSSSLLNPFNVKPEDLDSFKQFREELAPFAERLMPMPRTSPATVAVYYSYPAMVQARRSGGDVKLETSGWYTALLHRHFPLKIVFDEDLANLGPDVQALVFPGGCKAVPPKAVRDAEAFSRRGGFVLAAEGALVTDEYLKPLEGVPAFERVDSPSAAADTLEKRGVRRHAQLVPAEGAPFAMSDVQVVDRGDFKFVCCVNMGDNAPRRALLKVFVRERGARFRMADPLSGREVGVFTAKELAAGVPVELPSQERVLRTLTAVRAGK